MLAAVTTPGPFAVSFKVFLKFLSSELIFTSSPLIFKTTSLDANGTPNEGWDGRDKHGNLLPQDVYSWRAEAVFLDGSHYPFGNDVINVEGNEVNDVTVHRGSVLLLHR